MHARSRRPENRSIPSTRSCARRAPRSGCGRRRSAGFQPTLAVWLLDIASELLFVGDAGTTEASRPSRRLGFEWSNAYSPGPGCPSTRTSPTRARASATRIRPGTGFRARSKVWPPAGVYRDSERGRWSGALRVRYFGPRPLDRGQQRAVEGLDPRHRGAWPAASGAAGTRSRCDVFNLLDTRGRATSTTTTRHAYPASPPKASTTSTPTRRLRARSGSPSSRRSEPSGPSRRQRWRPSTGVTVSVCGRDAGRPGAPRTDPSERNYRTGLPPQVRRQRRCSGQGCTMPGAGSQRRAIRHMRCQVMRALWLRRLRPRCHSQTTRGEGFQGRIVQGHA